MGKEMSESDRYCLKELKLEKMTEETRMHIHIYIHICGSVYCIVHK